MQAPVTTELDRDELAAWYKRNRARSAQIFGLIDSTAFYDRPIPLRHPFVFYEGHLPAFSFLTLNERALGETPLDPTYEKLFERGIDPSSLTDAQRHERADWPTREQVAAFGRACDERVLDALANAELVVPSNPKLVRGQSAWAILEHEPMHHETLMYIVHQLDHAKKTCVPQQHVDAPRVSNDFVRIDRGIATIGVDPDDITFAWDNEMQRIELIVDAFNIQRYPVTNGEYLEYVRAGHKPPTFWIERDGEWFLHGVFDEIPLPLSWPVYVSHDEAEAYAAWAGLRLPTEAEYHRAAFGTAQKTERAFPWGDDAPEYKYGNFDFVRYDPEPVTAHPDGASAWGVHDLIGNGWEWTATVFGPLPGFAPLASYPNYSADFFDGKHYVMKGASPVTAKELVRRSFRNWFYHDYPYMYAKFRCVR